MKLYGAKITIHCSCATVYRSYMYVKPENSYSSDLSLIDFLLYKALQQKYIIRRPDTFVEFTDVKKIFFYSCQVFYVFKRFYFPNVL